MQPIPINLGTQPAVDLQVNNPRLKGAFVNPKDQIQLLPNTLQTLELGDLRAVFASSFQNIGRLILATSEDVFYLESGNLVEVGTIAHTSFAIRIAENAQGQIVIVNGIEAWVFDQPTNTFFQLTVDNGFDLTQPRDVTSLNTFLIIVGGDEKKWIVSNANDATQWQANEVQETDSKLGDLIGVESLDNNLFIFGVGGVERWVPAIERVPNSFPFSQDPTYQDEYGLVSTASLISQNNELFYLSEFGRIRYMTPTNKRTITNDGIEEIINNYVDKDKAFGSYWFHKGHYLYQLTFETEKNAFVYCPAANKFSESSDLIIGYSTVPIKEDGVYVFNNDYTQNFTEILIQTPYIKPKYTDLRERTALNCVILEMTQGKATDLPNQTCFLSLSKDNVLYGNREIGRAHV